MRSRTAEQLKYHREYMQNHRAKNLEVYRKRDKDRTKLRFASGERTLYLRSYHDKIKDEVIEKLGGVCACCGEHRKELLTLDHIKGKSDKPVSKTNGKLKGTVMQYREVINSGYDLTRFRILCFNCNCVRGHRGYCPHEKEEFSVIGLGC